MRQFAKWISQALLVVVGLLSGEWTLLDLLHLVGPDGKVHFLFWTFTEQRSHVDLKVRLIISFIALALIAAIDAWDMVVPPRNLRNFRTEYLALRLPEWRDQLNDNDIRLSILYVRRLWYWPFWRVFKWTWSDGFNPPNAHIGANLLLASWQGVSGQAFQTNAPQRAFYIRKDWSWSEKWLLRNEFRMTNSQLQKSSNVRGILSIPMLKSGVGASASFKAVGVINLDALSHEGAALLSSREIDLIRYFIPQGKLLALLDV